VLKILRKHGLADAQSVCIDATTLQASASMNSLVRRDTGHTYDDYLRQLTSAEGVENASKEQLARLDRKRKKNASNDDWTNPNGPSARIIGLYLNPPQNAAVFCVDENSAIQALDRLDRHLPLSPGRGGRPEAQSEGSQTFSVEIPGCSQPDSRVVAMSRGPTRNRTWTFLVLCLPGTCPHRPIGQSPNYC